MKKINNIGLINKCDYDIKYLLSKTTNSNIIDYYKGNNKSSILSDTYSPKNVCKKMKESLERIFNLLDMDVDTLILSTTCNYLRFYNPYEEILKDLGFKFRVLSISSIKINNTFKVYKEVKVLNHDLSFIKYIYHYINTLYLKNKLSKIDKLIKENIGFEINKGEYISTNKFFIKEILEQNTIFSIRKCYKKYLNKFNSIKIHKKDTIKVKVFGNDTYDVYSKLGIYNIEPNKESNILLYIKKQGCIKNIFYEQYLKEYSKKYNKKLIVIEDINNFGGILL